MVLLGSCQFSDWAMFHVDAKVNCHIVCIWGTEHPHIVLEHAHDLPKVNVFCAISSYKVHLPFFFLVPAVTIINYLDLLHLWPLPQLHEDKDDVIVHEGRAPPNSHLDVCSHLRVNLP
jgi:hypothetical protein